ncbi:MAG TPA: OsmC family protein [Paucimonas sp.]|nr:OsmC family protein [Paucimonas sp.]HJW54673.1 OsmC family protein [Burkholderiaceae bacterium]
MIRADSKDAKFLTQFTNGEHVSASDTTPDKGGGNRGFRPHELLEAAVASCMNMTLRMSAEKHFIPFSNVSVSVFLNRNAPENPTFEYCVDFPEAFSKEQRQVLLSALERCPVRNTLSKPLGFKPYQQSRLA